MSLRRGRERTRLSSVAAALGPSSAAPVLTLLVLVLSQVGLTPLPLHAGLYGRCTAGRDLHRPDLAAVPVETLVLARIPFVRYIGLLSYSLYLWHGWGLTVGRRFRACRPPGNSWQAPRLPACSPRGPTTSSNGRSSRSRSGLSRGPRVPKAFGRNCASDESVARASGPVLGLASAVRTVRKTEAVRSGEETVGLRAAAQVRKWSREARRACPGRKLEVASTEGGFDRLGVPGRRLRPLRYRGESVRWRSRFGQGQDPGVILQVLEDFGGIASSLSWLG